MSCSSCTSWCDQCTNCDTCRTPIVPRPCPDPLMTCPLVVEWVWTTVDLQCCDWHEQYVVNATPQQDVIVTSDDGSIDIDYNAWTKTYDLSGCCEDKFVSVDATDTPAFLEDQIIDSTDLAIRIVNVAHPSDGTRVLRPLLDQSKITFPWTAQFKVSCARDYIVNMFQDSSTIDFVDVWCKYEARLKDCQFIKPSTKLWMSADTIIQADPWLDAENIDWNMNGTNFYNWYYDIFPDLSTFAWVNMESSGSIVIPKEWFRRVSMKWNFDYNRWVNACRFIIERYTAWGSDVLIDCKRWKADWYWLAEPASWDAITWVNPVEQLWQDGFAASEIFHLNQWDSLYVIGRIDTAVTNGTWVWSDWLIIWRYAGLSSGWLLWWTTLNPEAWFSFSVERVSQLSGDSRYNLAC